MKSKRFYENEQYAKILVQTRNLEALEQFIKEVDIFGRRKISELNGMYEISKIFKRNKLYKLEDRLTYLAGDELNVFVYRARVTNLYRKYKKLTYPLSSILYFREHHSYDAIKSVRDAIWSIISVQEEGNSFFEKLKEFKDSALFLSIIEELEKIYIETLNRHNGELGMYYTVKRNYRKFFYHLEQYTENLDMFKNMTYESFVKVSKIISD